MSNALKNVKTQNLPQTEKDRKDQVKNNAGGFVYGVSDKTRLERFLILGTDGGTYYASEKDITKQNFDFLIDLATRDPLLLISTVVEVSKAGRAAKNSPAIFALAVAINTVAPEYKATVRTAVSEVCRTSTHLFEFAQYVENLGGWGRAKKSAVAAWYSDKSADTLALQAVKYRQRNGWTHRDLLRLSHPVLSPEAVPVVNFMLGKDTENAPRVIEGFRKAQAATSEAAVRAIVAEYNLPWEAVPTQFLNDPELWKVMVENRSVGHTAILRNITRMQKIGAFKDLKFAKTVADILSDPEEIKKGRLHPVAFLNAWGAYANLPSPDSWGSSVRSPNFDTTPAIVGALEDGFYASFENAPASNARTMLSIDVSGSMTWGPPSGLKFMDCRQAAGAMATVTLRKEPFVIVNAFTGGWRSQERLTQVNVSSRDNFGTVMEKIDAMPAGGTDCALPMIHAQQNGLEIDHFVVYTDNETWAGTVKPDKALRDYRQATGINAKLTVVGMTATNFTIADPKDAGMMDVVGFDANAPKVMADFARVK